MLWGAQSWCSWLGLSTIAIRRVTHRATLQWCRGVEGRPTGSHEPEKEVREPWPVSRQLIIRAKLRSSGIEERESIAKEVGARLAQSSAWEARDSRVSRSQAQKREEGAKSWEPEAKKLALKLLIFSGCLGREKIDSKLRQAGEKRCSFRANWYQARIR